MIFFKTIFVIYVTYSISVILHELAHFICAKLMRLKNVDIYIGEKFLAINIKRFHFSPLITSGYVEFDLNSLIIKKNWQIIIFYMAGAFANILIILISLIIMPYTKYSIYIVLVNVFCVLTNLFPLKKLHNDFGNCFLVFGKKRT
ncbi:MAG: site-2 protease family protein [Clostridia bacterium]|nr:site-2 protease family protein [Clostridia bacterium]